MKQEENNFNQDPYLLEREKKKKERKIINFVAIYLILSFVAMIYAISEFVIKEPPAYSCESVEECLSQAHSLLEGYNAVHESYPDKTEIDDSKIQKQIKDLGAIIEGYYVNSTKREFCYQVRDSKTNEVLCITSQGIIGRGDNCNSCKDVGLYSNIESIDGELENFLVEQLRKNPELVTKIDECSDTDKGLNLYEFGLVYAGGIILYDNCLNDKILEEKWCFKDPNSSSYYYGGIKKECSGTCLDDRCILFK